LRHRKQRKQPNRVATLRPCACRPQLKRNPLGDYT